MLVSLVATICMDVADSQTNQNNIWSEISEIIARSVSHSSQHLLNRELRKTGVLRLQAGDRKRKETWVGLNVSLSVFPFIIKQGHTSKTRLIIRKHTVLDPYAHSCQSCPRRSHPQLLPWFTCTLTSSMHTVLCPP